jgi:hypothetical protein
MSDTGSPKEDFSLLKAFLFSSPLISNQLLEDKLKRWAQPPGKTEEEKIERAVRMVTQAVEADPKLSKISIKVFPKGSFYNRTNIPSDSDVDVGVLAKDLYFNDYPAGASNSDFSFSTATYQYEDFKNDVATAIQNKFGKENVTVGSKAITVHANTVRVDADVVPHYVHRRYHKDGSYIEGVALKNREGEIIKNWPEQDYNNGVSKNERTGRRYKALARILKTLRGEMKDNGIEIAEKMPSYLIACLAWNVPDRLFDQGSYFLMVETSLMFLIDQTSSYEKVKEWGEVNELKYLFRSSQPWKLEDVHTFLRLALEFLRRMKS